MAKAAAIGRTRRKTRQGSGWMGGVFCGALLAVAPAYALLLGGSLLPGLAAWLISSARPRRTAVAMLLFGLAMTADRIGDLWQIGGSLGEAWNLLAAPVPLLMAWFAAAFGWALTELLPLAVSAAFEFEAQRQSLSLRRARRRVVEGWELGDR